MKSSGSSSRRASPNPKSGSFRRPITIIRKTVLFEQVRCGEVRVLIGSTPRMGAGTNVQNRLVALHHVDVTWKPSDIEQREGRIVRQGNELLQKYGEDFEVEIVAYATERTVDAKDVVPECHQIEGDQRHPQI